VVDLTEFNELSLF